MAKLNPGMKFNKLTLRERIKNEEGKQIGWMCNCDCGNEKLIKNISTVVNGKSTSCGCARSELLKTNNPMFDKKIAEKVSKAIRSDPNRKEIIKKASSLAWTSEARAKRISTNIDKYGTEAPQTSQQVKDKTAQTNINKYGSVAPAGSKDVLNKMKKTCLRKYGTDSWMKVSENAQYIAEQVKKTRREKGVYLLPDGRPLVDVCVEKGLLATSARNILRKRGINSLLSWLESDDRSQSSLEYKAIELFNNSGLEAKTYNVQVPELAKDGIKYRPDIVIYDLYNNPIYVDIDGLYFHSEKKLPNNYHMNKQTEYNIRGIRYLQIREDELLGNSLNIVIGMLKNIKGDNKKIHARKTKVVNISAQSANEFLINNHLMGAIHGAKHIALCDEENKILSVMSYKKIKDTIDISRFATKIGITVVGGFSKLLKNIDTEGCKGIQSFVDLRYANGNSLLKLGFKCASITLGWQWTDGNFTYNRSYCTANMDGRELAERDYAREMKIYKIYDAGQAKFVLPINSTN